MHDVSSLNFVVFSAKFIPSPEPVQRRPERRRAKKSRIELPKRRVLLFCVALARRACGVKEFAVNRRASPCCAKLKQWLQMLGVRLEFIVFEFVLWLQRLNGFKWSFYL